MIFLVPSKTHIEPELELFEVWGDDLLHYSLRSADLMSDTCGYFLSRRGPLVTIFSLIMVVRKAINWAQKS